MAVVRTATTSTLTFYATSTHSAGLHNVLVVLVLVVVVVVVVSVVITVHAICKAIREALTP